MIKEVWLLHSIRCPRSTYIRAWDVYSQCTHGTVEFKANKQEWNIHIPTCKKYGWDSPRSWIQEIEEVIGYGIVTIQNLSYKKDDLEPVYESGYCWGYYIQRDVLRLQRELYGKRVACPYCHEKLEHTDELHRDVLIKRWGIIPVNKSKRYVACTINEHTDGNYQCREAARKELTKQIREGKCLRKLKGLLKSTQVALRENNQDVYQSLKKEYTRLTTLRGL